MNIKELQERYSRMETNELIPIAFANADEYTEEAIQVAVTELKKRNVSLEAESTINTANEIKQKNEQKRKEIATQPLSRGKKRLFFFLPGLAYWYIVFTPKEWTQRRKDANRSFYFGLLMWLMVIFMLWLLFR